MNPSASIPSAAAPPVEEALRASEERFRAITDQMADVVFVTDDRGFITTISAAARTVFGFDPAEMLHRQFTDFLQPSEIPRAVAEYQKTLQTGEATRDLELRMKRRDGTLFPGELNASVFRLAGTSGTLGVIRDITERQRAQEALQQVRANLEATLQALPDLMFEVDREGRIHDYRAPHPQFLYAPPSAFLGKLAREVLPAEVATVIEKAIAKAAERGRHTGSVYELQMTEGARWYDLSIAAKGDPRSPQARFVALTRDITERRRAEQKLETALAEKTVLLREVHHRVKNSLQAMISLMRLRDDQIQDPAMRQLLAQLEEQARTMALVYEQLYQAGDLARVQMQTYLQELARNVFRAFGGARAIQLRIEAEGVMFEAERAMPCGLIVNELVTNALKYAFPADFAGTPIIRVGLRPCEGKFELQVTDNGVGLPAGLDREHLRSLGLRLVQLWATHQMDGTLSTDTAHGTAYVITFA